MNKISPEFFVFFNPSKRIPNTPKEREEAFQTIEGFEGLEGMRDRVGIKITRDPLTGNLVVSRTEQGNSQSYEILPHDDPRMFDRPGDYPFS